jgi:ferric-dicitrate binding protein FerR (iron transport regulator)
MANRMCEGSPRRDELCRAVDEGLGDRANQAASARFDDMDALLNAIRAHVQEPSLAAAFERLQQAHRANLDAFSKAQAAERSAATQDQRCAEHITYAPVASELRAALGCGALRKCQVVCTPDPPKP